MLYYGCVEGGQEVKTMPAPGVVLGYRHKVAAVLQ